MIRNMMMAGLWCAILSAAAVLLLFGAIIHVDLSELLAMLGLVPAGSALVGALIALTLQPEEAGESH